MPGVPAGLVISGPTAVGKTETLWHLARASPWPVEVVSADAFQVYRGLDKGTAKPDHELLSAVPHHLLDIREVTESYTLGDFLRDAVAAMADIRARGRLPVVCGGTVYYIKHLLYGSPETPPADLAIRQDLIGQWNGGGAEALRAELARVDPQSSGRIHANDAYRILRALEVWRCSGRPLSDFSSSGHGGLSAASGVPVFVLERPRDELVDRIGLRVAAMLRGGLAAEVGSLWAAGANPDMPGMRAIGYQEFFDRDGSGGWRLRDDLETVEEEIAIHTRQYAKRQMTFLRSLPEAVWLPAADPRAVVSEMMRRLQKPDAGG